MSSEGFTPRVSPRRMQTRSSVAEIPFAKPKKTPTRDTAAEVPVPTPRRSLPNGDLKGMKTRPRAGVADVLPPRMEDSQLTTDRVHPMDMPAHALRDSLLFSKSGFTNYRGLYNLGLLALIVSSCGVALENFRKYGILVEPASWLKVFALDTHRLPIFLTWASLILYMLFPLYVEKLASKRLISDFTAKALHITNIFASVCIPSAVILYYHPFPVASFLLLFEVCLVTMKLASYFHTNQHNRRKYFAQKKTDSPASSVNVTPTKADNAASNSTANDDDDEESDGNDQLVLTHVQYPDNLSLLDTMYFLAAPTLCYELNFPRRRTIRKRFVMRRLFEVVILLTMIVSLGQQWLAPTVHNTFKSNPSLSYLIQRTMKLAVPNFFIWLMSFYMFFHSFLNLSGELLRFGDRQFYRDWWNATTISWFWRNWNIPVHKWAVRHVYRPMIMRGFSRLQCQLAVFFVSALMHELLVSVPLCMFRTWSFFSMLFQIPLAIFTERYLKDSQYGNVVVWASLFIGQPTAIMLYVQAYISEHSPVEAVAPSS